MRIAIASGKGGTGKTTVSVNLFAAFQEAENDVVLVDCDVEEPNAELFMKTQKVSEEEVFQMLPEIVGSKCVFCGKCAEICAYNAIMMVKSIGHIKVLPELCHSCGACSYVCPTEGAIVEYSKKLGVVTLLSLSENAQPELVVGELKTGEALAVPVIKKTKEIAFGLQRGITLIDSPPGTSCPAMETVQDADFVVLVAEPTPFGMNDLKIMLQTVKKMGLKTGVVINRADKGTDDLERYLQDQNVMVLTKIPFMRSIAEKYSEGKLLYQYDEMKPYFLEIKEKIMNLNLNHGADSCC